MDGRLMDGWKDDGWMNGQLDGWWMDRSTDESMDACMDACMDG